MSDMSFLTAVKAKSFLHTAITFVSSELAILAQFVGVEGEVDTLVDSPIPMSFTEQLIM